MKNRITRDDLALHLAEFNKVADDPEFGGSLIDWVWDWLYSRGIGGHLTDSLSRWIILGGPQT